MEHFAANIVIGFGRIGGMVVGFVSNQPTVKAGTLDIDASDKAARFVRFCNVYNIPIVTLVDVPGFLPGVAEERRGYYSSRRKNALRICLCYCSQDHCYHA